MLQRTAPALDPGWGLEPVTQSPVCRSSDLGPHDLETPWPSGAIKTLSARCSKWTGPRRNGCCASDSNGRSMDAVHQNFTPKRPPASVSRTVRTIPSTNHCDSLISECTRDTLASVTLAPWGHSGFASSAPASEAGIQAASRNPEESTEEVPHEAPSHPTVCLLCRVGSVQRSLSQLQGPHCP